MIPHSFVAVLAGRQPGGVLRPALRNPPLISVLKHFNEYRYHLPPVTDRYSLFTGAKPLFASKLMLFLNLVAVLEASI